MEGSDANQVLEDARHVLARVARFPNPTRMSTSRRYIEILQDLSLVLVHTSSIVGSLLNSARPINRLPPEVLSGIFSKAATFDAIEGHEGEIAFHLPSPTESIKLSKVCKHWRAVALATAYLWSGVICDERFSPVYERYLPLSRSGNLHVCVKGDAGTAMTLFRDQPSRVKSLFVEEEKPPGWTMRRDPRDLLALVASDLTTCVLHLPIWPRTLPSGSTCPFFSGQASLLRQLTIYDMRVIPSDNFPCLTTLFLGDRIGSIPPQSMLALLGRCPRLVTAHIESRYMVSSSQQDCPIVAFADLREIELITNNTMWLLAHISVPSRCRVRAGSIALKQFEEVSMLPLSNQPSTSRLTRMGVFCKPVRGLVHRWGRQVDVDLNDSSPASIVSFILATSSSTPREEISASIGHALATASLFSSVTVLWVVGLPTSYMLTPFILRTLPNLTFLGITFDERIRIKGFVETLNDITNRRLTFCPRLTGLCMYNYNRTEGDHTPCFLRIAATRARYGARLRYLAVEVRNETILRDETILRQCRTDVEKVVMRARLGPWPPEEWRGDPRCPDSSPWTMRDEFIRV